MWGLCHSLLAISLAFHLPFTWTSKKYAIVCHFSQRPVPRAATTVRYSAGFRDRSAFWAVGNLKWVLNDLHCNLEGVSSAKFSRQKIWQHYTTYIYIYLYLYIFHNFDTFFTPFLGSPMAEGLRPTSSSAFTQMPQRNHGVSSCWGSETNSSTIHVERYRPFVWVFFLITTWSKLYMYIYVCNRVYIYIYDVFLFIYIYINMYTEF